jgi:hypothetical protein
MNDAQREWHRMARESEEAHVAFLTYRDMGTDRSIEAASRKHTKSLQNFKELSARHNWVERSRSWDNYLQRERDKVAVQEARKWERRCQQALESNWEVAQQLRAKLEKILAWPMERQTTSKDGKTVVIEPARWSYQTVALLARTAAEIGAATLQAVAADVDALTDAEARATSEEPGTGAGS